MNRDKYKVVLWLDGKPSEQHEFSLTEKRWYVSAISIGAFDKREKTRLYEQHQKGLWDVMGKRCSVKWGEDAMHDMLYPQVLPVFHHEDVWEFYKAIGYDYKKQRYVA